MDTKMSWFQYSDLLRKYWLPLSLGLVGLIFLVYGLISFLGLASKSSEVTFTKASENAQTSNLIAVDIEGAVLKPGVYKLSADSIIQDALVASGGLSDEADRDFVSKNINLASKLTEGAKIYIPVKGESTSQTQANSSSSESQTGLININSASSQELDSLPGIGPVTSEKIINSRPYSSVNDLLDKKVVSSKVFTGIKDRITAY